MLRGKNERTNLFFSEFHLVLSFLCSSELDSEVALTVHGANDSRQRVIPDDCVDRSMISVTFP